MATKTIDFLLACLRKLRRAYRLSRAAYVNYRTDPIYRPTLHGKRHLNNPPLVSGVDVNLFPEKVERGKGFDWNIALVPRSTASHVVTEDGMDTKTVYRFKVEIVH